MPEDNSYTNKTEVLYDILSKLPKTKSLLTIL